MNLTFKKATPNDIPLIDQLAHKIWKEHYPSIITVDQIDYMLNKMYSPEAIQQQMNEGQQFTLVYDNDEPVGYASTSAKDGKNYFLHKFYVDTSKHRKGIGGVLYEHLITGLKPQSIELTVNRKNFKAINFYFKKGFTIDHVADFDIGNGYFMNDLVMIRKF
jgi:GNAT superfamily N-acetyltransferase